MKEAGISQKLWAVFHNRISVLRYSIGLAPVPDLAIALTYQCDLGCNYCYARGLKGYMPKEMKFSDFGDVISWLTKQRKKNIILTGGEPTQYSHINEVLDLCLKKNMSIWLVTNGLFSPALYPRIDKKLFYLIWLNFNPKSYYTKKQWELFQRNMAYLKSQSIPFSLKCNLSKDKDNHEQILYAASANKAPIYIGITFSGFSKNNYLGFTDIALLKRKIFGLVSRAKKMRIRCVFSTPLPRCIFSDHEWKFLRDCSMATSKCNVEHVSKFFGGARVVNPDLSVHACFNVFIQAPSLFEFSDVKELENYFREPLLRAKWKIPLFRNCIQCDNFKKKKCQGACLGAKNVPDLRIEAITK